MLSRLLDCELRNKNISGIKAISNGPPITHVMYANDIILFSKANAKDARCLVNVLDKYCIWSGQCVNKGKSGVFFSKHTQPQHQRTIKNIIQFKSLKKDTIYLGAPLPLESPI